LRKVRLNKAMELLKEQSYTVSEVAFTIGFGSADYFSKCFKNYFGYSPGEVEKNQEDQDEAQSVKDQINVLKNFPVQTSSFIGRENEIKTIVELLEKYRIVSLIGTGGCSKTRLACETVLKLEKEYQDGFWFVELAPIEAEELVIKQLMSTLEITEVPGKDMMEVLIGKIRDRNF